MAMRLVKLLAPTVLFLAAGPASAQHHGGGGHVGGAYVGGVHMGGSYGGGRGGGYHGGYSGGYRGYRGGYGYRGYGYGGYPFLGYGLGYGGYGYGLGYGGIGYGLGYGGIGYGGYGYSYPYSSGYYTPYSNDDYYSVPPTVIGGTIIQASGTATSTAAAAPATVTVVVPEDAQVWFDGKEGATSGVNRVFTSPALESGQVSVLSVRARWDGRDREMRLSIRAGDTIRVDLRSF